MTDETAKGAPAPDIVDFNVVLSEDLGELAGIRGFRPPDSDLETLGSASQESNLLAWSRVGLALSGGGIRSAAFAMGVTQALEASGIFKTVGFLSTVSGGGYVGASIVAAMYRDEGRFPFSTAEAESLPVTDADIADSDQVKRVRDRCRYLLPHGKFDLLVSIAIILRGLVVNATMVGWALCAAVAASLFLFPTAADLSRSWPSRLLGLDLPTPGAPPGLLASDFVLSKLFGISLVAWCVLWAVLRSITVSAHRAAPGASPDPGSRQAKATGVALGALVVLVALEAQQPVLRWATSPGRLPQGDVAFWDRFGIAGVAVVAGTVALAFSWRLLVGTLQRTAGRRTWSAVVKAAVGRATLWLLASVLPLGLYGTYVAMTAAALVPGEGLQRPPAVLAWAFGVTGPAWPIAVSACLVGAIILWNAGIGPVYATLLDPAWWRSGRARQARTTLWAVVAALVLPAAWPAAALAEKAVALTEPFSAAWCYLAAANVLGALTVLFTENATSLHSFYRDRLDEAFNYRGTDGKPLAISDLRPPTSPVPGRRYPPKLIVNAAVNMQGSPSNRRARGADYFTFTHSRVGSDATRYAPTKAFEDAEPRVDLATVVAISGAAVSAAMGRASVPLLAPTLALLNVRLGFWLRNPRFAVRRDSAAAAARRDWTLPYLLLEGLGLLTEQRSKVYVTDGGHIDNLGVRQLLERRCDLVIVSDAEADPGMDFPALIDVQRFARIDLGIRIELPWQSIRNAALTRKASLAGVTDASSGTGPRAVLGVIHYPPGRGQPAETGTLLYIKAMTTGRERDYVRDYERRFPAFPHESTGDQFFTEEQFEAYRALGYQAAAEASALLQEPIFPR